MFRFFASLIVMFAILCTLWCTAARAECERRPLANDVAGQYVVTCDGSQVTAPSGTARTLRRAPVRRVVGESVVRVRAQRVGVTHIVARMGARS
jgi:hypothetical protein